MSGRHHQVAAVVLLAICASAYGQADAVGRYAGSFLAHAAGREVNVGMTVVISKVEGELVEGVATVNARTCGGEWPFTGTLKGTELVLRSSVKGGATGDCQFGLRGSLEGNKISGTYGRLPVQLTK